MEISVKNPAFRTSVKSIVLDVAAIAFIYLMPALSHMMALPVYFIEPMRLMVILAMVHTHRNNAYILALTLPIVSYFISAHPVFIKSVLIAIELVAMTGLFFLLRRYIDIALAIFSSIIISKLLYYGLKYITILTVLPEETIVGIPLMMQLIMTFIFTGYVYFMLRSKQA